MTLKVPVLILEEEGIGLRDFGLATSNLCLILSLRYSTFDPTSMPGEFLHVRGGDTDSFEK